MKRILFSLVLLSCLNAEVLTRADGSQITIHNDGTWTPVTHSLPVNDSLFKLVKPKEGRGTYVALKSGPIAIGDELGGNAILISPEKENEAYLLDMHVYGAESCILKNAEAFFYFNGGTKFSLQSHHDYDCERRLRLHLLDNTSGFSMLLKGHLKKIRIKTVEGYFEIKVKPEEAEKLQYILSELKK